MNLYTENKNDRRTRKRSFETLSIKKKKEKRKKNYRVDQNKSFILNMFYIENKLLSSLSKTMS